MEPTKDQTGAPWPRSIFPVNSFPKAGDPKDAALR